MSSAETPVVSEVIKVRPPEQKGLPAHIRLREELRVDFHNFVADQTKLKSLQAPRFTKINTLEVNHPWVLKRSASLSGKM